MNEKSLKRKFFLPFYRIVYKLMAGKGLKKFRIIQSFDILLKKKFYTNFVELNGYKMYLSEKPEFGDSLDLSSLGKFEPFETKILKKNVNKGDYVIDLGGSVGYYTLLLAKIVGPKGKVFTFESDPDKFRILKKNVELNNFKNIILIQSYVSNKTDTNTPNPTVALDDYFKNEKTPLSLIKMDIEGAEVFALEGMQNTLRKNPKIKIFTEFHTKELKKNNTKPEYMITYLQKMDFSIFNIDEKDKKMTLISEKELFANYPNEEIFTNLFCKR